MRHTALLLKIACAHAMVTTSSVQRARPTVSLAEVLSTCVDAAMRGCEEIRAVQSRRDAGTELSVAMKDETDARSALTEADLAAQRAMVGALRSAWPGLTIIGEEDEEDEDAAASTAAPPLRRDLCAELGDMGLEAPLDELCVFVDPLDGDALTPPAPSDAAMHRNSSRRRHQSPPPPLLPHPHSPRRHA